MAKLPIGEKVFVIETGEMGYIIDYLPDFTVAVNIEGEMKKVHQTAIVAAREFGAVKGKEKIKPEEKIAFPDVKGVGIMFQAIENRMNEITRFDVLLINNTALDLQFLYTYFLLNKLHYKINKEIQAGTSLLLHEFKTDQLNDGPVFRIEFHKKVTEGASEIFFTKEIKLKAKQFFSRLDSEEFKRNKYIVFDIMDAPDKQEDKISDSDDFEMEIDTYKKIPVKKNKIREHELLQKAHMPDFIDLHIEKIEENYQLLSSADIIQIQLRHCRNYLDRAMRYKLEKVYIIHGIGKGVLKQEILKLLDSYPDIISFNNNYNPRFGYGATEVILQ